MKYSAGADSVNCSLWHQIHHNSDVESCQNVKKICGGTLKRKDVVCTSTVVLLVVFSAAGAVRMLQM